MKGTTLSKEEVLEAEQLYEKINRLVFDGQKDVFSCALANCLSDLIAQLSYIYKKDPELLLNSVTEDIKRQIGKKSKHIEKIISETH